MNGYNIERGLDTATKRLDSTLNSVRSQASEGFGLNGQVGERPWLMLGAALAIGFVFGSMTGGDSDDDDRSDYRNDLIERDRGSYRNSNQSSYANASYSDRGDQQDIRKKAAQYTSQEYGGPSSYGSSSSKSESTLPSTSYSANTGASSPASFASIAPSEPQEPGPIASKVNQQLDGVVATAGEAVRNFLRDTIRDAVPSMRDQVDALDRRDGRTPPSSTTSTARTSSARLYEVDDATTRTSDPSLT